METRLLFVLLMIFGSYAYAQNLHNPLLKFDFVGKKYIEAVDFSNKKIDSIASFDSAIFNSKADFNFTQFNSKADFFIANFDSTANFKSARFSLKARFVQTQFKSVANFNDTKFYSGVAFSSAVFNSFAYFNRAKFHSYASFNGAQFRSQVGFNMAKFYSRVDFDNAKFYSKADFRHSQFDLKADFSGSEFDSITDFGNVKFSSNIDFTGTNFKTTANFTNAAFDSITDFDGAEFGTEADFGCTKFNSYANFRAVKYNGEAYFGHAIFNSPADFSFVEFDHSANFIGVIIKDNIYFKRNKLPYYLNLSGIEIHGSKLDLTDSYINEKYGICFISLINSDIENIKLRYSMFKLYFPENIDIDTKANVYEKLLKTQKDNGYISSYEKLDKEYIEFKYLKSGKYSSIGGWILNLVNKLWWGYGYDKVLIIRNTLILFAIFSIINCIFFPWISHIYELPKLIKVTQTITAKNIVMQRIKLLPAAIFFTGLIFFGLKFSTEKLKYKENLVGLRFFNLSYFFLIYLSGLVCLGYMANFILST